MKCSLDDVVTIVKTGTPLDNTVVKETGIAVALPTYIVEREDGRLFQTVSGPWCTIVITEHCLTK